MFPPEALAPIQVYHLSSAAGKQTYTKDEDITEGAILPMSAHAHALIGVEEYGDPKWLYVDVNADVRVNDKVVAKGVTWYIRHIMKADIVSDLEHQRCVIDTDAPSGT